MGEKVTVELEACEVQFLTRFMAHHVLGPAAAQHLYEKLVKVVGRRPEELGPLKPTTIQHHYTSRPMFDWEVK